MVHCYPHSLINAMPSGVIFIGSSLGTADQKVHYANAAAPPAPEVAKPRLVDEDSALLDGPALEGEACRKTT